MGINLNSCPPHLKAKILEQLERNGKDGKIEVTWYLLHIRVSDVPDGKVFEFPPSRNALDIQKRALKHQLKWPNSIVTVYTYTTMEKE
jgi:hypothetical protein